MNRQKSFNGQKSIYRQLRQALLGRRQKAWIYILCVLWIAVIVQIGVNNLLLPKPSLLEAFVGTNTTVSAFELEMYASYDKGYLTEEDKKNLVYYLADTINLKAEEEPAVLANGDETEVVIEKSGKNADTSIKVVTLKQQGDDKTEELGNYILIRLKLYNDTESLLGYRKLLENALQELKVENVQTTMQLSSTYKGKLALETMNKLADGMIDNLGGKIAYANREESLFTVYAYSGLLKEYVTSMGNKINIHVAIQYDEDTDATVVYLGTPVINGGY